MGLTRPEGRLSPSTLIRESLLRGGEAKRPLTCRSGGFSLNSCLYKDLMDGKFQKKFEKLPPQFDAKFPCGSESKTILG